MTHPHSVLCLARWITKAMTNMHVTVTKGFCGADLRKFHVPFGETSCKPTSMGITLGIKVSTSLFFDNPTVADFLACTYNHSFHLQQLILLPISSDVHITSVFVFLHSWIRCYHYDVTTLNDEHQLIFVEFVCYGATLRYVTMVRYGTFCVCACVRVCDAAWSVCQRRCEAAHFNSC